MITLNQNDLEEVLQALGLDDRFGTEDMLELHLEWGNSYIRVHGGDTELIRIYNEYEKCCDRDA